MLLQTARQHRFAGRRAFLCSAVEDKVENLRKKLFQQKIVLLSGAGISTDSGIPDYRSPGRPPHKPMTHSEFMATHQQRSRYWARSFVGYEFMSSRAPNIAHTTIAAAQEAGQIHSIITQNVDGLHQKAGSHNVLDLHGNLHSVKCMSCGQTSSRQVLQEMLRDCNSLLLEETVAAAAAAAAADAGMQRPDGDAALESIPDGSFSFPSCAACKDGILKPDVVFFGDNLPIERREESFRLVDEADMLLVAGTTVTTYSAFRLVKRMLAKGGAVAMVNRGPTRADSVIDPAFKIEASVGATLKALFC